MANSSDLAHIPPAGHKNTPPRPDPARIHAHTADFERILQSLLRVDPDVRLACDASGKLTVLCDDDKADAVEAALKKELCNVPTCPACAAEFKVRFPNGCSQ